MKRASGHEEHTVPEMVMLNEGRAFHTVILDDLCPRLVLLDNICERILQSKFGVRRISRHEEACWSPELPGFYPFLIDP